MSCSSLRPLAIASTLALCSLVFVGCTTTSRDGRTGVAPSKATINAQAEAMLARLYSEVPGAREIGAIAKGILVFPAVVGGSLVVGAEYGRGSLRSMRAPVVGFVLANAGLDVGASVQGTKVTELQL